MRASNAAHDGPADQVSRFDRVADRYREELDRALKWAGSDSSYFYRAKVALIKRVASPNPRVILDFGCGVGELTRMLATAFPMSRVIGVDASLASLDVARSIASADGLPPTYFNRLEDIGVNPDIAIAAGVLHHIPAAERRRMLGEIADCLAPSGRVVVFEHNPISPFARLIVARAKMDEGVSLIYPWQMRRLLKQAKMPSVHLDYISFFPPYVKWLLPLEIYLRRIPLSAQYMAVAGK